MTIAVKKKLILQPWNEKQLILTCCMDKTKDYSFVCYSQTMPWKIFLNRIEYEITKKTSSGLNDFDLIRDKNGYFKDAILYKKYLGKIILSESYAAINNNNKDTQHLTQACPQILYNSYNNFEIVNKMYKLLKLVLKK